MRFIAKLETTSYDFMSFGATKGEAISMLKKKWAAHQKETGAWGTWDYYSDSVWVLEIPTKATADYTDRFVA
jgi:hypothetical protein